VAIATSLDVPSPLSLRRRLYRHAAATIVAPGVVHAWVGQKLLNCFIFKCFTRKTLKKISIGHR
jgi:hypothetical protein